MLCSVCHRQLARTDARCRACGTPCEGARHLDLVLPGGECVPLDRSLVIGRAPASELRLEDPSVSRTHAEIELENAAAHIQDAGSSYGTFVDGRRLTGKVALAPGMRIEVGDCRLEVSERADGAAAGVTVSVPAGISLIVEQPSVRCARLRGYGARKPRLRSGWSLKRLDAAEAEERHVLKDHRSGALVRLASPEAELVRLPDGTRGLVDLIGEATARCGADGPARLARLLTELADRGLLVGVEEAPGRSGRARWLERLLSPRERSCHARRR
jgi:hypothetical protein